LALKVDEAKVLASHGTIQIGVLPPQFSRVVACISLGWKYSATVVEALGTPDDPTIRVLVVGAPGQT
jgi:hypothetical protein